MADFERRPAGTSAHDADAAPLVTALRVIQERWRLIAAVTAGVLVIVLALALSSTKEYSATATLQIRPSEAAAIVNPSVNANADPVREQATALLLVTSGTVAEDVRSRLKTPRSTGDLLASVTAASEPDANLISVTSTDPSPAEAARVANTFASEFAAYRFRQSRSQLDTQAAELRAQLKSTSTALQDERQRIGQTLSEVLRLRAVTSGGVEVVDRAGVPSTPSSPRPKRDAAVALLLGLAIGLGLAFLLDLFDQRVKSVATFEALYGFPALAGVPERPADPSSRRDRQAFLEPFRILRNDAALLNAGRGVHTLMVTSAVTGEGKSTVAIGLARAVARSEQSVVLVEADLRRPTFHQRFDLGDDDRGLSTALTDDVSVAELVRPVQTDLPSLQVLPGGPVPFNAAELLRSPRFASVLEDLTALADVVILDAPPLLPVADSQILLDNRGIDACLVVARAHRTTREDARRASAIIDRHRQRSLGLVVNGLREVDSGYDYDSPPASVATRA